MMKEEHVAKSFLFKKDLKQQFAVNYIQYHQLNQPFKIVI